MPGPSHPRLATFVEQAIAQSPTIARIESELRRQGVLQEALQSELRRQGVLQEALQSDLRRQGVLQEALQSDVKQILDAVLTLVPLKPRVDRHGEEIEDLRGDVRMTHRMRQER